jgi:hypothetical protein
MTLNYQQRGMIESNARLDNKMQHSEHLGGVSVALVVTKGALLLATHGPRIHHNELLIV